MDFKWIIARIKGLFKKKPPVLDFKSSKFLNQVKEVIHLLKKENDNTYQWHFKSLESKNLIEPVHIVDEFILIQKKKSNLPLRERELITGIIGMAIVKSNKKK
jgi:hypothetical protein